MLHIKFNTPSIDIYSQYLSRLGVPFFFAVSGMLLSRSIQKRGRINAMTHFLSRTIKLLVIWLLLYSPILYHGDYTIMDIIFNTPAYLWYLTAMIFAAIPFCLISNRNLLYIISTALYLFATLYSGSYDWACGELYWYNQIFGTTRNGLLFSLPMMCVGEGVLKSKNLRANVYFNFLIIGLYIVEMTFVLKHREPFSDNSLYFTLPFITFIILRYLVTLSVSPNLNYRKLSGAIYLMQFGIIQVCFKIFHLLSDKINVSCAPYITYLLVIVLPLLLCRVKKINRITNLIF